MILLFQDLSFYNSTAKLKKKLINLNSVRENTLKAS